MTVAIQADCNFIVTVVITLYLLTSEQREDETFNHNTSEPDVCFRHSFIIESTVAEEFVDYASPEVRFKSFICHLRCQTLWKTRTQKKTTQKLIHALLSFTENYHCYLIFFFFGLLRFLKQTSLSPETKVVAIPYLFNLRIVT